MGKLTPWAGSAYPHEPITKHRIMVFLFVALGFGAIVAVLVVSQMNLGDGTKEDRLISVEAEPLW